MVLGIKENLFSSDTSFHKFYVGLKGVSEIKDGSVVFSEIGVEQQN